MEKRDSIIMANTELFVSPIREITTKDYDILDFVPKDKKDEGYAIVDDQSLPDLCSWVIMICSNYAYHDKASKSKYQDILYKLYGDPLNTKRITVLKVGIPDITDTYSIIKIRRLFKDYLNLYDLINTTRGGENSPIDEIIRKCELPTNKKGFNPYIAGKSYEYAKSTISRCINFLLYSVLYNIGAGLKNGTQTCTAVSKYPISTIYKISDSRNKISISLIIDSGDMGADLTISSELSIK